MTREELIKTWAKARLHGRSLQVGLVFHLVEGLRLPEAAKRAGLSESALQRAHEKFMTAHRSMSWGK